MDGAIQAIEIWESRYIAPYFSKEEGFPICLLSVLKILSNFHANAKYVKYAHNLGLTVTKLHKKEQIV